MRAKKSRAEGNLKGRKKLALGQPPRGLACSEPARRRHYSTILLPAALAVLLVACGSGGDGGSLTAAPVIPPTITSVSGTVQTGQTLTISGTSMVQEDRSNWDPLLANNPNASGFEGASYAADGWEGGEAFSYVIDVKLMGSQSALSHHAGATITNHTNISYNSKLTIGGDLYFRAYLRFKVASGIWADNYHKIFASYGTNSVFLDWIGNLDGSAYARVFLQTDSADTYVNLPEGPVQEERWYLVELKLPSGPPHNYKVWIDNHLLIDYDDTISPQGSAYDMQFDINHCCTPPGYVKDNWWDGFVVSRTRVGPASLIEIGNSSNYATATKIYQAPEYLSDPSSQIKVNLTGLGAGPYFLWVTNNRGARSQPHRL